MTSTCMSPVDHGELGASVTFRLFFAFTGNYVEFPTVSSGLEDVHVQGLEPLVGISTSLHSARGRVMLEKTIQNHPIALFVGVGPVKNESWICLEPKNVFGRTMPWYERKPTGKVPVKGVGVVAIGKCLRTPKQWEII